MVNIFSICRFFHHTVGTRKTISVPAGTRSSNTNLRAKAVKVPGQESNHHGDERRGRKVSRGSRGARVAQSISRRARLAPSRVPARQTRKRAATRAERGPVGTCSRDDLNYNVPAERMKAPQARRARTRTRRWTPQSSASRLSSRAYAATPPTVRCVSHPAPPETRVGRRGRLFPHRLFALKRRPVNTAVSR